METNTDLERFYSKVQKQDSCWEWVGAVQSERNPYGRFKLHGKSELAHRLSYQWNVGPIPDGLLVCHSCDNPRCVNPEHLFVGTPKDNMQDCAAKGRNPSAPKDNCKQGHDLNAAGARRKTGACVMCHRARNREWMRVHRAGRST
jgi:hypothetical protein